MTTPKPSRRVARVQTLETAWRLVDILDAWGSRFDPPVSFMVVLPNRETVEVWPAVGSPLRVIDRKAIQKLVKEFATSGYEGDAKEKEKPDAIVVSDLY
jgi:hypothetical protein